MATSAPIKVALVDDQTLIRTGFSMVINSQPDLEVVLEANDGQEAVEKLRSHFVDVVLMDVRMPRLDGIEATKQILAEKTPERAPKVIVLTTFDVDEYVMSAIKVGASGFLLKDAHPEDLLTAIRTVYAGDAVIAPSTTKRLLEHMVSTTHPTPQPEHLTAINQLTEREKEVLVLMARGFSNNEIAQELFVAEATVKTHVGRVLAKLGARDRVQAVIIAYECQLVVPGS